MKVFGVGTLVLHDNVLERRKKVTKETCIQYLVAFVGFDSVAFVSALLFLLS